MRQAVAFKMAFVGAPMIYYGTEAGMWSPDDLSNRMPMVWEEFEPYEGKGVGFDRSLFDWYRRCIAVRHTLEALRTGTYRTVHADDRAGVFVFERRLDDQVVYVAINRRNQSQRIRFETDPALDGKPMIDVMHSGELAEPGSASKRVTISLPTSSDLRYVPARGELRFAIPAWGTRVLVAEDHLAK